MDTPKTIKIVIARLCADAMQKMDLSAPRLPAIEDTTSMVSTKRVERCQSGFRA